MKILVVEDDIDILDSIASFLEKNRYIVDKCSDGNDALGFLLNGEYEVCLLDINLPNISGVEILKTVRHKNIKTPIIIITAKSQLKSKIENFELGADDYIVKPFHLKEVLLRVNSVIRRSSLNKDVLLKIGNWSVYPEKLLCISDSKIEVEISNKEMQLLVYLIRNKNKYISSEEILEHVWDREFNFFSDTIKTHIKNLRNKIDKNKNLIKTSKGKGYGVFDKIHD